ncbi:MAG TPA: outer membrane beta-barrel protein [Pyrinomonadaceae bacterium]|nr:outer membrane beta-barrel protein [Pyrinomonadaceae bacterium]
MKIYDRLPVIISLLCLSFCSIQAQAQSDEVPKFELGAQFTSITKPSYSGGVTEPGFGGRFTFNLNRSVALEAVGNFFPHKCNYCGSGGAAGDNSGNIAQGLFGVKAGKRFQKWGIFAKARPGVVSFSEGDSDYFLNLPSGFGITQKRGNHFAGDLGGVLEFYPSQRIVTRFEAGDTMIHYGQRQIHILTFNPITNAPTLIPFTTRSETRHNFQFSAGVGWRF